MPTLDPATDRPTGGWLDVSMQTALNGPTGPFDLDVTLSIAERSFVALVGPSGAGKTTLLRLLAGLARPKSGRLSVGGIAWNDTALGIDVPTRSRAIGFVFQDYALFPNMTVRRNVEYAMGSATSPAQVQALLERVDLDGLAGAYPARLSGGQKQRLALIRALARRPRILMLDEPLSALDPAMRYRLQDDLRSLHATFGTTTIMVSHDASEVLRLADRVVRLEQGRVVFDGAPATAFGAQAGASAVSVSAQHLSGPDEAGLSTVIISGRTVKVRYRNQPGQLEPGDSVLLRADEVDVQRLLQ